MKQSVIVLTCRLYLINLIAIAMFFGLITLNIILAFFSELNIFILILEFFFLYTIISKISKVESILKTEICGSIETIDYNEYYNLVRININASKYDFLLKFYLKYLLKYN